VRELRRDGFAATMRSRRSLGEGVPTLLRHPPSLAPDLVCRPYIPLFVIAIAVGVVSACNRGASTPDVTDARIDALFGEWNTRDSPGCGVGVKRNGAMLFERGYGMANLERKIPISSSTIFDPASIAKPFTALSIMLLAEQGKLSLDDEMWKHVPEWVNRQDRITIRHLLAHTAVLRDAFS